MKEHAFNDHREYRDIKKEIKSNGSIPARFEPDLNKGLSSKQVNIKIIRGKVNFQGKQYSKSTAKIICSNLFTVFNLLCIICIAALALVKASPLNYMFSITYVSNVTIAIVQEIKAKKSIEKLSLLNQPNATVLREGKYLDISVNSIVEDDIIKFTIGNQICADCTVLQGAIEVNESLLTGESIPIKKKK